MVDNVKGNNNRNKKIFADWRNYLSPVRDQGSFGTCAYHASTGVIEAGHRINASKFGAENALENRKLSVQHSIQLCPYEPPANYNTVYEILKAIMLNGGLALDDHCTPYHGCVLPEHQFKIPEVYPKFGISGFRPLTYNDTKINDIKNAMEDGPLIGSLIIRDNFFKESGIIMGYEEDEFGKRSWHKETADPEDPTVSAAHSVILCTMKKKNQLTYFDFQNSYGEGYGRKGFGKIALHCIHDIVRVYCD